MANPDRPNGFTPVQHLNGSPTNFMTNYYNIAALYGTAIFTGDIVKLAGSADVNGVPTIARAGATDLPVGVVVGMEVKPASGLDTLYSLASTLNYVLVCDDPKVIMEAQCDGTMTALEMGLNTKPTTTAGNTTSGISREELSYSDVNTTNTLMLKILRLAPIPGNTIGADAVLLCKFNVHAHSVSTGADAT